MTAKVYHADLFGTRSQKYARLNSDTARISDTNWIEVTPNPPFYLFVPQEQKVREEYERGESIQSIFPVNSVAPVTGRDALVLDFSEEDLSKKIDGLMEGAVKDEYKLAGKLSAIRAEKSQGISTKCVYKPLDYRPFYYHPLVLERARDQTSRHMLKHNCALTFTRTTTPTLPFDHVLATRYLPIGRTFSDLAAITYFSPLYLYPAPNSLEADTERRVNINPEFIKEISRLIGEEPTPEDIFGYVYAILYAPTYRARYADFLKRDFPRIPLPPDADTFKSGAEVGAKLVALHLLEDPALNNTGITFPKAGTGTVEKMRADKRYIPPANGRPGYVRLNDTQYFGNVPPEAWAFRVGGYQPAFKWLDDRAGRTLTEDDINHYRKMLAAMRDTIFL